MDIHSVAMVAGIVLPFWNIPLIMRIVRRKSSEDVSIYWAVGVWGSLALMAPSAFVSKDPVWRYFSIINFIIFTFVTFIVVIYRKRKT